MDSDLPPDVHVSISIWFRPELDPNTGQTINHCLDAIGLAGLDCEVGHFVRFLQTDTHTFHCPDLDRMPHLEIPFDGVRYHAIFCDCFLFEHCRRIVANRGYNITLNGRAQQCHIEFHFLSPFTIVDRLGQSIAAHHAAVTAHDNAIAILQQQTQALNALIGNLTRELDATRTLVTTTLRALQQASPLRRIRVHQANNATTDP